MQIYFGSHMCHILRILAYSTVKFIQPDVCKEPWKHTEMSRNSLSNQRMYNLVEEEKTSPILCRLWYVLCKCCSHTRFSSDCWVPECSVVISTQKLLQCSSNGNMSYTRINLLDSVLHLCVIQIKCPGSACVSFPGLGNVLTGPRADFPVQTCCICPRFFNWLTRDFT